MGKKYRLQQNKQDDEESLNEELYQQMVNRLRKDISSGTFSERRSTMDEHVNETTLNEKEKDLELKQKELMLKEKELELFERENKLTADRASRKSLFINGETFDNGSNTTNTHVIQDNGSRYSFDDVKNSVCTFNGEDNYPVEKWVRDFEETSKIFGWKERDQFFYARRLLEGDARLLIRAATGLNSWDNLKDFLQKEFGVKTNSAVIHKKMAERKKKPDETLQRYLIELREIGATGSLEESAIIQYCVDGIQDKESNKQILYGAVNMNDFKAKLKCYDEMCLKSRNSTTLSKPATTNNSIANKPQGTRNFKMRCFECGANGHVGKSCPNKGNGPMCYNCKAFGHVSLKCPKRGCPKECSAIQSNTSVFNKDLKVIRFGNMELVAMIDNGSDINLISERKFKTLDIPNWDEKVINFNGVGSKLKSKGCFASTIGIENDEYEMVFHVVDDNLLPYEVILGRELIRQAITILTPDDVIMRKFVPENTILAIEEEGESINISYLKNLEVADENQKMVVGNSPFELLRGVRIRVPEDLRVKEAVDQEVAQKLYDERVEDRQLTKRQIEAVQDENLRTFKKRRKVATFYDVGDIVAIKRTQFITGSKLLPKFLGPYRVIRVKRGDRYEVAKIGNAAGPQTTSTGAENMKKWFYGNSEQATTCEYESDEISSNEAETQPSGSADTAGGPSRKH